MFMKIYYIYFSISNLFICINECENLINSFLIICFNDFKQECRKRFGLENYDQYQIYEAKEWQTIECNFLQQRIFLFKAFRFSNYLMMPYYALLWFPLQMVFFLINLLSNLNILRLVFGDSSCSGNSKQVFFMIPSIFVLQKGP